MDSDKAKHRKRRKIDYITVRCVMVMGLLTCFALVMLILFTSSTLSVESRAADYLLQAGLYCMFGLLLHLAYRFFYIPYKETENVYRLFAEGYLLQDLFEVEAPLSPQTEAATNKFRELLDIKELIKLTKKQAEYRALQNQINPHLLYNALEGIRSEALYAGIDSVAEMTEALATFFRYTISNSEHMVTLEDELGNVEDYCIIQQFRFGKRMKYIVEIDPEDAPEILKYKVPKLILQPIVENAICHGIERKIGQGVVHINIVSTNARCIVTISDNGKGMSEEMVEKQNEKLKSTSVEKFYQENENEKGNGIALENVNNRIKILFGDEYGLCLYSKVNVGTDVVLTFPVVKE